MHSNESIDPHVKKEYLLWALYYLKKNCTEGDAYKTFGMNEKIYRKWKYYMII